MDARHSQQDVTARLRALEEDAVRKERCAAEMARLASDFRRWGLSEQEGATRHSARAMRIEAMLVRAKAASLLSVATDDRLTK